LSKQLVDTLSLQTKAFAELQEACRQKDVEIVRSIAETAQARRKVEDPQ
jgi:hypothetical protein